MMRYTDIDSIISNISSAGWPDEEVSFDVIDGIICHAIERMKDISPDDLQVEIIAAIMKGREKQQLSLLLSLDLLAWRNEGLSRSTIDSLFNIVITDKFSATVRDRALFTSLFLCDRYELSRLEYILRNAEKTIIENSFVLSDITMQRIQNMQRRCLFWETETVMNLFYTELCSKSYKPSKVLIPSNPTEKSSLYIKVRGHGWKIEFRPEPQIIIVSKKYLLKYHEKYATDLRGVYSHKEVIKETINYIVSYEYKKGSGLNGTVEL